MCVCLLGSTEVFIWLLLVAAEFWARWAFARLQQGNSCKDLDKLSEVRSVNGVQPLRMEPPCLGVVYWEQRAKLPDWPLLEMGCTPGAMWFGYFVLVLVAPI